MVSIIELKAKFIDAGYSLKRTKIEVPLEYISLGKSFFPDYKGGYFEWHGKIEFQEKEALERLSVSLVIKLLVYIEVCKPHILNSHKFSSMVYWTNIAYTAGPEPMTCFSQIRIMLF